MITVSCPKCHKNYTFDESQIPPDLEVLQCKLCKTHFVLAPDDDNSPFEDLLFFEPIEEIQTKEENTISRLDFSADQFPLESEEDDQILELTEQMQIREKNPIPRSALTGSMLPFKPIENNSSFVARATGEVKIDEESKFPQDGFAAERFRYLNAKRKNSRKKIFLYCSIALLSLFLICYVFLM